MIDFVEELLNIDPITFLSTHSLGYFMYIETSSPRQPGDVAVLESKLYPAPVRGRCLHFYYHMYGEHMGELIVLLSPDNGIDTEIWMENKDKGNQWILQQVQIPPSVSPYRVSFGQGWVRIGVSGGGGGGGGDTGSFSF